MIGIFKWGPLDKKHFRKTFRNFFSTPCEWKSEKGIIGWILSTGQTREKTRTKLKIVCTDGAWKWKINRHIPIERDFCRFTSFFQTTIGNWVNSIYSRIIHVNGCYNHSFSRNTQIFRKLWVIANDSAHQCNDTASISRVDYYDDRTWMPNRNAVTDWWNLNSFIPFPSNFTFRRFVKYSVIWSHNYNDKTSLQTTTLCEQWVDHNDGTQN